LAIYGVTILAAENKKLRAANEKVRKKRVKKTVFVSKGGTLTTQEVQES
jgi:hypothetical protein